jgi:hypothetical protein
VPFLEGRTGPVVERLNQAMAAAAEDLQYEKAAAIRDQLNAIDRVVERQKVVSSDQTDSDVIAMARADGEACVQVFFIRSGKLIGREYFILEGTEEEADGEVLAEFVKQFYAQAAFVPQRCCCPRSWPKPRSSTSGSTAGSPAKRSRSPSPPGPQPRAGRDGGRERGRDAQFAAHPLGGRQEPPDGRAERTAGSARPARAAQPDRVLRYLDHPGRGQRGQHGRLRAGHADQEALPALQHQDRAGAG